MAILNFEDLSFYKKDDYVIIKFLDIFITKLSMSQLYNISKKIIIQKHSIEFKDVSEKKVQKRFNFLLSESFKSLKNTITGKPAVYIHKNSGIPLIGNLSFGIIDRNTTLIEIKPITSCNLDCIYCSVDQSKRQTDFIVEKDYLVEELKKLILFKESNDLEIHIGTQGEPLLYSPLINLIKDISSIKQVRSISIDTNGTMITKDKADKLIDAGLTQFNLSINALDSNLSKKIANAPYDIKNITDLAKHISRSNARLIITPVWIPKINDKEIPKLIELSKSLGCDIGIQNFLNYRFGKDPAKELSWKTFYDNLKELEVKHDTKLLLTEQDFNIKKTKPLPKPFKKGDMIKANLVCSGRMKNELIAVSDDRNITVSGLRLDLSKDSIKRDNIKLKITRDKHNIFYSKVI